MLKLLLEKRAWSQDGDGCSWATQWLRSKSSLALIWPWWARSIGEIHSPLCPLTPSTAMPTACCLQTAGPQLDIQNRPYSLKDLCLHGGKEEQRERLAETSALALVTASWVSHQQWHSGMVSWALPHAGDQKQVRARKEWAVVSLILSHPHRQKWRFILASYGCLRPETYH